jgi:hypothetical protein
MGGTTPQPHDFVLNEVKLKLEAAELKYEIIH